MTVEEVRAKFEIQTLDQWRRLGSTDTVTEPRPHIVPLDSEAEGFVTWLRDQPTNTGLAIFGKFYTGFGTALIGDRWTHTFRFISISDDEAVNAFIHLARVYPVYLGAHEGSTEKMEIPKQE